jgi:hypothetical protein
VMLNPLITRDRAPLAAHPSRRKQAPTPIY